MSNHIFKENNTKYCKIKEQNSVIRCAFLSFYESQFLTVFSFFVLILTSHYL